MQNKKIEDLNKGELIKAELYSRPNAIDGRYRACQIGLDNLSHIKDSDIFFLETLKVRADSADKIISEAELQGKNMNDPNTMKELGRKINALGEPLHKSESVMTAIFVSLRLILYYGVALGIWGFIFKKSFLEFGLYGIILGILICLLFVAPVITFQRTKERVKDMVFGTSLTWGNLGLIIGILGLVTLVIKLIFLK